MAIPISGSYNSKVEFDNFNAIGANPKNNQTISTQSGTNEMT